MADQVCSYERKFLCENDIEEVFEKNRMFSFNFDDVKNMDAFQIVFRHPQSSNRNFSSTPGFSVSWYIRSSNGSISKELPPKTEDWHRLVPQSKSLDTALLATRAFVSKAKRAGIANDQILQAALNIKRKCLQDYKSFTSVIDTAMETLNMTKT